MAKRIPLTQGKFAIVDPEDYEWLSRYKWHVVRYKHTFYAGRTIGKWPNHGMVLMHRQILGLTEGDGKKTDHKNHNSLDNRRFNLRICTNQENFQNQRSRRNTSSRYKGVSWHRENKKWRVRIGYNYKQANLGCFQSEVEAAKVYDNAAKELFGEFACLNFKEQ